MKSRDLDELLKSAKVPARPDEYWESFPGDVTMRLRRGDTSTRGEWLRSRSARWPIFAWGLGVAAVCFFLGLHLGFWRGRDSNISTGQLAEVKKYYHEIETLFPNRVRAIVFDKQGPHILLSDAADVPNSPALFLKICGPKGCESLVTFSGQTVGVNGEKMEVLADAQGKVIVVGNHGVWAGGNNSGPIRIQSKPLESMM
jgi:hypothetical protein